VAYHQRWMLERVERQVPHQDTLRFVGGGAQSAAWAQILADVTRREIKVVENAQNAGTIGAAIVCGVGLGILGSFQEAKPLIRVAQSYQPRAEYAAVYERSFAVFKDLYKNNRSMFRSLNEH
jgi:xylulokinase